ncbi:hypothetical protein SAMN05444422_11731 [Halobiforma haloterrestris]|uniref:Uncharacterized protein n=1 Tax=Natronobacterium haloterrestre TaxID=148448 RepID=A0A1I1LIF4_NATHA|nr:hypothetical protein [Halobiforma haloterrestris]SFC72745.1 hypothetical protein SAMN05444422_11731 [Halobiforma haloterrestris]
MDPQRHTDIDRRTVLKATPPVLVGASAVTGRVGANALEAEEKAAGTNALEVVARHDEETDEHRFELNTEAVAPGWTTVTLENRTEHTHFAYLARVPPAVFEGAREDGVDPLDYYIEHVTRPFQWFMDDIDPAKEPDPDDLSDKYSVPEAEVIFPEWFEGVVPSGGTGLTSPETTSVTSVDLEPGDYILECFVKDGDGEFHSYQGMIRLVTAGDDRSDGSKAEPDTKAEPEATLGLTLSTAGIDAEDHVRPGRHTVAVQFANQRVYEHLLGHDVHLLRFGEGTSVDDVNDWMNWMDPTGLVSNGEEPRRFLGGVQPILTPALLEGEGTETAYVHVDLHPGTYAWVSAVPDPAEKGLLEPFEVSDSH